MPDSREPEPGVHLEVNEPRARVFPVLLAQIRSCDSSAVCAFPNKLQVEFSAYPRRLYSSIRFSFRAETFLQDLLAVLQKI